MGSAPVRQAANRGLEELRVKLGCVQVGEPPAVFSDALRYLSRRATYLYQDGSRYWYDTQPTVTKKAEEEAEVLKRSPEKVLEEFKIQNDLIEIRRSENEVEREIKVKIEFNS